VSEQQSIRPGEMMSEFPARIVELIARPHLNDLPENPVGKILDQRGESSRIGSSAISGATPKCTPPWVSGTASSGSR